MVSVQNDVGLVYKPSRKNRMEHVYEEIVAGSCKKIKYVQHHLDQDENRPTPCKRNKNMLHTPERVISPSCVDQMMLPRMPFTSTSILNNKINAADNTYLSPATTMAKDLNKHLKAQGQLKIAASLYQGVLEVHVIQGRQLSTREKPISDTFVKVAIIPDGESKQGTSKTSIVSDSSNPLYDHRFSFIIAEEDLKKRIHITVWNSPKKSMCEFLGGMSFGVQHVLNPKKDVMGWYHFLTEEISQHKHLRVSTKARMTPYKKAASSDKIVDPDTLTVSLSRGSKGFGFTVVDSNPVKIGKVDKSSPASVAGLCPGDHVIAVNGHNVSRSHSSSVAKIVKNGGQTLILDIQRATSFSFLQRSLWQTEPTLLLDPMDIRPSHDKGYTSESDLSDTDEGIYSWPSNHTSTPKKDNSQASMSERRVSKLINQLLTEESNFINVMHAGMQKYSRPLRHSILSTQQHLTLFQNIEKLVMISQFLVKQIQNNVPTSESSSSDSDSSSSSTAADTAQHIGKIYQSKIAMLCQAYDLYAKGITTANKVLSDLSSSDDFIKFIRGSSVEGTEPSISSFIYLPVQHVVRVYHLLQQILTSIKETSLSATMDTFKVTVQSLSSYPSVSQILSLASLSSEGPLSRTSSTSSGQGQFPTFQEY